MKKIAIITLSGGTNYGNKLQNYAVQAVLKKFGYISETITNNTRQGTKNSTSLTTLIAKLKPSYLLKVLRTRTANALHIKNDGEGVLQSLIWKFIYKNRIAAAMEQRKNSFARYDETNIIRSKISISMDNIDVEGIGDYEYFVCGSDQVWNPYYPQNSMIEFLCFVPEYKRVAYAPSFGVNHIPDHKIQLYKSWISAIPHLSVREEQGATIINELTGRDATVLVDPTFMLNKDEWLTVARKPDLLSVGDKFVLTYFLGNKKREYQRVIHNMAESAGCRVINLGEIREFDSYAVDPGEFIYLVSKAALVCTDSFHGAVFSIIMRTNFLVFNRVEDGHSMGSRLETLLRKFGMEDRLYNKMQSVNDVFKTDFSGIDRIVGIERDKAFGYLGRALHSEKCHG